ncbi:beta-lactamase family protein [Parapedobacter sp. SGR-10]|uniref:serine hydrolase domain-containing protein n=1 Tax=Parapedobacter sp. SGR-10 TaxID=2710879 RepID=UPI0013D1B594|nr:serine hydrolase domain-containing protein [Parapedobacter sp. SGR-10]NGF55201.1 beta-lactamase family protein [Parapedobacter sp. SGR-10]
MKKYNKIILFLILTGQMVVWQACSSGIEDELTIKKNPDRYETSNPDPDPDPEPNPDPVKPLPEELASIAQSNGIPGVQIAYIKGDQVDSYIYGVTDLNSMTPLTEDHVFQAASVSKAVAAYVFLRLYDKGVYDLDRPLHEYYYYDRVARANNPKNGLITARHVLAHLTGYPNWVGTVQSTAWWTSILEPGDNYTPGVDYRYSGEGFTYLQEVLKHLTGKSLQQMAWEEVFEPFGMVNTSFEWLPSVFSGKNTRGHRVIDGALAVSDDPMTRWTGKNPNSAFTMITNAKDFTKFMKRGLMKGEGLRPETYALLTTIASWPEGINDPHLSRGLGMVIHKNEKGTSLYHSGSNSGYLAYFIMNIDQDEGVVVFTNSNPAGRVMGENAFPFFLGADQTFYMFE